MLNCFFFSSSFLLHMQHKYYLLFRLSTRAIPIDFFIYVRREPYSIIHLQFVHHVLFSAHIMTTYRMATSNVQRTRSLTHSQHLTLDVFFCLTHIYDVLVCGCAPVVCMSLSFRQSTIVVMMLCCRCRRKQSLDTYTHKHLTTDNSPKSYNFKRVFYSVALNSFGALRSLPLFLSVFLS